MTVLKVIGACLAGLLLIPVLVLGAVAGGFGDGSASAVPPADVSVFDGDPGDLAQAVLSHPAIHLIGAARSDVEAGVVDARVLQLLLLLAQTHELGPVGPFVTGHSYYVKGTTRVSNHVYGRAVDILGVDGMPVSPANEAAREVMEQILTFPEPLAPDELGGPWVITVGSRSSFADAAHRDHIHAGHDDLARG